MDRHLAQIVYIIPEAVNIDKVMIHDKKTLCMKPEMIISLQLDIVKGHSEHSDFLALHKVFASRVSKYFVMHPEVLFYMTIRKQLYFIIQIKLQKIMPK